MFNTFGNCDIEAKNSYFEENVSFQPFDTKLDLIVKLSLEKARCLIIALPWLSFIIALQGLMFK